MKVTGSAGSCIVYNAHLWHSGTQNCTDKLRRAQHAFFSRSHRPSSTDVPAVIDKEVYERLGRVERAGIGCWVGFPRSLHRHDERQVHCFGAFEQEIARLRQLLRSQMFDH